MIRLIDVSKYYVTDLGRHYVFQDVTLDLPLDKSIGVLGPNGAGKSTFLRILGGADIPSSGRILRTGRISPPMGLTPGLQTSLNAVENVRFAGRIYGMDRDEINDMIDYVRELANIGKFFDLPVATYSTGMRQRVGFAINMSMDFDYYLFDEISAGGDREFRNMAKEMVKQRLQTSKFIMTSHSTDEILELCQAGIVIRNGELRYFEDINEAAAFYGEDESRGRGRRRRADRNAGGGADTARRGRLTPEERRERRRQLREERKQMLSGPETAGAGDGPPATAPLPAPGQQDQLAAAAPGDPRAAPGAAGPARAELRARRLARIEEKRRARHAARAAAGAAAEAPDAPEAPAGDQPPPQPESRARRAVRRRGRVRAGTKKDKVAATPELSRPEPAAAGTSADDGAAPIRRHRHS